MAAIEAAGEIMVDLNVITADLNAKLNAALTKGGKMLQPSTPLEDPGDMSLLQTPCSDMVPSIYDNVSVLESDCTVSPDLANLPSYTVFTATCSKTQATSLSSHHLEWMAFAAMVMDGAALIASGQQLHSADGILLELLSLNEAKLHDDWNKWQQAMIDEMASMNKMDVFELADIPLDGKLIGVCWVFKLKLDTQ
ncbi:hypothetical protein NDA11_006320 [Ustilago hordei]|uniref:Reverse transcriptase Ty1/copia-type domain-containing protein n=1 Tax=Ustilago hordei TaxID=120017 RepID=I2FX13_USTHO|nr:hypothetical protein NDA10_004819 [Ustilago hordei]KAJ1573695.1 hypothetical protein NDA15_001843 [Ustilago hordei]KAJ1579429.1 hypothetical protein NDA11_006320 [Ustilago hordei]KAJ1579509.1 hypothetical protein NDA12_000271 [Ustilago hordei]KAJ1598607.1 hypothetical protein NDA14_005043 [Ustilago hordei]